MTNHLPLRLANATLFGPDGASRVRNGSTYYLRGPACLRIEPSFVFRREILHYSLRRDGVLITNRTIQVDRKTIAVFQDIVSDRAGLCVICFGFSGGEEITFSVEVDRTCGRMESASFAGQCESFFDWNRNVVQSQPFSEMLKSTRTALDTAGARIVFVTGSVGKTTTKELLCNVLEDDFEIIRSTDSWNFPHEICSQVLNNISWCKCFIMEAALGRHLTAMGIHLPPDLLLFVEVGKVHTSLATDVLHIARQKAALGAHMRAGSAIIASVDNPYISQSVEELEVVRSGRVRLIGVSTDVEGSGYVSVRNQGSQVSITDRQTGRENRFDLGRAEIVPNKTIGCVYAASLWLRGGAQWTEADSEAVKNFRSVPGRLEEIRIGDVLIVNDAYNSNPVSMARFLDTIAKMSERGSRVFLVLGEMMDLGELSESEHRWAVSRVLDLAVRTIYVGDGYQDLCAEKDWFPSGSLSELRDLVFREWEAHDVFAFKGSHATGIFDVVEEVISKAKYWVEADASSACHTHLYETKLERQPHDDN